MTTAWLLHQPPPPGAAILQSYDGCQEGRLRAKGVCPKGAARGEVRGCHQECRGAKERVVPPEAVQLPDGRQASRCYPPVRIRVHGS